MLLLFGKFKNIYFGYVPYVMFIRYSSLTVRPCRLKFDDCHVTLYWVRLTQSRDNYLICEKRNNRTYYNKLTDTC